MSISYAGIPLAHNCIELQDYVDTYLPFSQGNVIAPSITANMLRNDPLGSNKVPNVCGPNYPPKPRLRFNELYWPTGASRWAEGYFLCDTSILQQIIAEVGSTAKPLIMQGKGTLKADMYLLPPRPLTGVANVNVPWVIPLVDERYFWQFGHNAEGAVSDYYNDSWDELFDALFSTVDAIGSISTSTIDSRYAVPEPACFRREYGPAVLIDAAAHSVGRRFVKQLDGSGSVNSWDESFALLTENITQQFEQIAGGYFTLAFPLWLKPGSLRIEFPIVNGECGWWAENQELETPNGGRTKGIVTFAAANTSSPTNLTEIDDLASVIAEDFAKSIKYLYDVSFSGINPWKFSGHDDHVLFSMRMTPKGEYICTTRAVSAPYNFGVEEMYHAFADTPTFPGKDHLTGKLDGTLSQGGSATVSVWDGPAGSESDTGLNVTAYDWLMKSGATAIASGKKVFLTRICGIWYATNAECA